MNMQHRRVPVPPGGTIRLNNHAMMKAYFVWYVHQRARDPDHGTTRVRIRNRAKRMQLQ